ncbi:hypothetical protein [Dermacoccus nishinomiyaensis]|uniref:hypothetical protein n=1 Tax=Dermacoccus nishinomiyaensis TaxID=1274 RepID=UPI000E1C14CD|nr:hypothetical protein [Dermacoccus nishinomiyaensis]
MSIVALGKWLREKGFDVGQHPAFGGVAPRPTHMATSLHYVGQALDVNADGMAGGEAAAFDRLAPALIDAGWATIWRGPGHYDHLHVDTGLYGVLNEKQYGPISKTNMIVEGLKSVGGRDHVGRLRPAEGWRLQAHRRRRRQVRWWRLHEEDPRWHREEGC